MARGRQNNNNNRRNSSTSHTSNDENHYRPGRRDDKVELCKFWMNDNCRYGRDCKFAHPPKTPPASHRFENRQEDRQQQKKNPKNNQQKGGGGAKNSNSQPPSQTLAALLRGGGGALRPVPPPDRDGDVHMCMCDVLREQHFLEMQAKLQNVEYMLSGWIMNAASTPEDQQKMYDLMMRAQLNFIQN